MKLKKRELYMNVIHYTQNTNYNIENILLIMRYFSFEYHYL